MENVTSTFGYIYIVHEREFINANLHIYKIGNTESIARRLPQYPKGSHLKFCVQTCNFVAFEKDIIKLFDDKFVQKKDIGREYYEGDVISMITTIASMVENYNESDNATISTEPAHDLQMLWFLHHISKVTSCINDIMTYTFEYLFAMFLRVQGETTISKDLFRKYMNKIGREVGITTCIKGKHEIYRFFPNSLSEMLRLDKYSPLIPCPYLDLQRNVLKVLRGNNNK